jgi:tripartite-type tricarboxylate transporter receptor subunit TctC
MNCRLFSLLAAAAFAAVFCGAAAAQDWPSKPVRIIVPFAPGGTADTWGRILADGYSEAFKQQFFVENKPGSGGLIGSQQVARAAPDGYTLLISGVGSHVIAAGVNPNAGFDPIKDFTHIAMLGGPPIAIIANPSTGIKTMDDLLKYVKASQKTVGFGSPGVGSNGHLFGEYIAQKLGIKLEHIPYRGAALAVTDVVGGHVPLASTTLTTAAAQIRAGTVNGIAVTSKQRIKSFPEIPTFIELGYDISSSTWFSLSGPAGLAPDIVDKLNKEVPNILAQPKVKQKLDADGITADPMSPAEFVKTMQEEIARWVPVAKSAGVKPE